MKLITRVILTPFVALYGIGLIISMTVFPLCFFVPYSIAGFILEPIFILLRKSGTSVDSFVTYTGNYKHVMIGHFIGATIHVWGPFYIVWNYLKNGEIYKIPQ